MGSKMKNTRNKQQAKAGNAQTKPAATANRTLPMQKPGSRFAPLLRKFNFNTQPQQSTMAQPSLQPKEIPQPSAGQVTPQPEQQSPSIPFKEATMSQTPQQQTPPNMPAVPQAPTTPMTPAPQIVSPAQQMQAQQGQMYQIEPGPAKSQAEIEEEKKKQMGQI